MSKNSKTSKKSLRKVTFPKSVVVPYVRLFPSNEIRFLMFQDTKSSDWSFVSGGCKKTEDAYTCANRELYEESKRTLEMKHMVNMFSYQFTSKWAPPEHKKQHLDRKLDVTTHFNVFIVKLPFVTEQQLSAFVSAYRKKSKKAGVFDETKDAAFLTVPEVIYQRTHRIWEFMNAEIIPTVMQYGNAGFLQ